MILRNLGRDSTCYVCGMCGSLCVAGSNRWASLIALITLGVRSNSTDLPGNSGIIGRETRPRPVGAPLTAPLQINYGNSITGPLLRISRPLPPALPITLTTAVSIAGTVTIARPLAIAVTGSPIIAVPLAVAGTITIPRRAFGRCLRPRCGLHEGDPGSGLDSCLLGKS